MSDIDREYEAALQAAAANGGGPIPEFDRRHPFERAGLDKPPYRLIGVEKKVHTIPGVPIQQPGSSCDYCGTGIMFEYWFKGKEGKQFKTGSDCAFKAFKEAKDMRGVRLVQTAKSKHEKEVRETRSDKKIGTGIAWLDSPGIKEALQKIPHPQEWRAKKGETYLQMVEWYLVNAGRSGQEKILSAAKKVYEAATGSKAIAPEGVIAPKRQRPAPPPPPARWRPDWREDEYLASKTVYRRGKGPETAYVRAYFLGDERHDPKLALGGPYNEDVIAGARALKGWWEGLQREWHFFVPNQAVADEVVKLLDLYKK